MRQEDQDLKSPEPHLPQDHPEETLNERERWLAQFTGAPSYLALLRRLLETDDDEYPIA